MNPRLATILIPLLLAALLAARPAAPQTAPPPPPPPPQTRPIGPAIGVPTPGMPFVHDPSTVVRFHGKYYVYSTGRGIPFYSSPDLLTWTREGSVFTQIPDAVHAAVPKNDGASVWAPDILRVGNLFYLYYAVSSWGSFNSAIALATNPVLDPHDPAYRWTDRGVVVASDGQEDLNAIDPGAILTPEGQLWICYGSYHGSIRITQLDPTTGLALKPKELGQPVATARNSEASDIIAHDGFYYLFVNHNSCCKGKDSEYNIRVGRARAIAGPYLDRHNLPMTQAGGSLFLAAHDHRIGPGHFGRLLDYDQPPDGAERFSIHYEADTSRGGRSVLDVRPLLWTSDGWPLAGDNLPRATYQLLSRQTESTLEETKSAARLAPYLTLPNQQWTIAPIEGGFYKILNAATADALGAPTASPASNTPGPIELTPYTAAPTQLWTLEQFPNGGWRLRNKATGNSLRAPTPTIPAAPNPAPNPSTPTLAPFTPDDPSLWTLTTP
jgi:Glycosyl hydrolases family 43/Ricin-type beta-trefoil lectin domain-like